MTALEQIRRLAVQDRIAITRHADARMRERNATRADVANALISASVARWQPDQSTYRVEGGVDLAGDELTVAVVIQDDLIVVTVF